jgi:hypothetical protein
MITISKADRDLNNKNHPFGWFLSSSGEWISYLDGIRTLKIKNHPFGWFVTSSGESISYLDGIRTTP